MDAALRQVGEMIYATHTGTPTESEVLLAKLQEIDALRAGHPPAGAGDRPAPGRRGVPRLRGPGPEGRRILPGMRRETVDGIHV